ncbi:MAG: hypothetical protein ACR2RB_08035 [Gammaproteobacteria bacterium]
MPEIDSGEIIRLQTARDALRDYFLGWQCRVQQIAVRQHGGRPDDGMCPSVRVGDDIEILLFTPDWATTRADPGPP